MRLHRPSAPVRRHTDSVSRPGPARDGFARGPALLLAAGILGLVISGLMFLGLFGPAASTSGGTGLASWKILLLVALMVSLAALQMIRVVGAISRLRNPGPLSGAVRWPGSDETVPLDADARKPSETFGPVRDPRTDPYQCPACGARIQEGDEVSPKGDVKCPYCTGWFNIYEA